MTRVAGILESEVERLFAPAYAAAAVAVRAWASSPPQRGSHLAVPIGPHWLACSVTGVRDEDGVLSIHVHGYAVTASVGWTGPTEEQEELLAGLARSGPRHVSKRIRHFLRSLAATGLSDEAMTTAVREGLADHVLDA